ncbi:unnamed protein product [Polarella glacialis]|uniref:Phosphoribulokinase/uridine kinase domain-containing protein n=1 Tax=Polarella glacialis TaxID=89957 RepID=A0A813KTF9_POLGL|nr:unnamed protein product [Polarella glacialis]CAE8707865.1 unnamed protein product [Polarella glacialis]
MVRAAVLQAPVSDREAIQMQSERGEMGDCELERFRAAASSMIAEGQGDEVMPRAAWLLLGPPHPVTAYRFHSLTGRLTDDDMFSSDLSDQELHARLGHVAVPTLLALSADDEYVPSHVDPEQLSSRLGDSMAAGRAGLVQRLILAEGGHGLRSPAAASSFVSATAEFLARTLASHVGPTRPEVTWEPQVAAELMALAAAMPPGRPLLVALAGMPGSGKTTAAASLQRLLGSQCLVLPMDGYHEPLAALRARPDAADAVYRRGAPDTFDPASLKARLAEMRDLSGPDEIDLPGFDHAIGDPTEGAHRFQRQRHCVVLVEGLYLLHDSDGWAGTAELFDRRIYLEADLEACIARIKVRNKVIPGYTAEEIDIRCDKVDRQCALLVKLSANLADLTVTSGVG